MDLPTPHTSTSQPDQPRSFRGPFGAGTCERHHACSVRQFGIGPRLRQTQGYFLMARAAWTNNPDFWQTSPTEVAETLEEIQGLGLSGKPGARQTIPYDHPIEDSIASRI